MSARAIRNGVVSAALGAALALGVAPAPASALDGTTTTTACNPEPSASAYAVLGFLWGDGHAGAYAGDWLFRTTSPKVAEKFSTSLAALPHRRVEVRTIDGVTAFSVKGLCLDVTPGGTPSLLSVATRTQRKEFLAGVITGEGSHEGLVLDDPEPTRGSTMRRQLGKVDIGTSATGTAYVRVYADAVDWDKFQTFPFVVWSRVPGA